VAAEFGCSQNTDDEQGVAALLAQSAGQDRSPFSRSQDRREPQRLNPSDEAVRGADFMRLYREVSFNFPNNRRVFTSLLRGLERFRNICDQHGFLLIFDEVITGFGRLGAAFAARKAFCSCTMSPTFATSGFWPLSISNHATERRAHAAPNARAEATTTAC
jgi:hypothetical protein